MTPTIARAGSPTSDLMAAISETIRGVSLKARGTVIAADSLLVEDLALDSIDLLAIVLRLEDLFQIEFDPEEIGSLKTVGDLVARLDYRVGGGPKAGFGPRCSGASPQTVQSSHASYLKHSLVGLLV